jgi:alpha,alpha-trehalose phosphorylase (configuration-retaining)
LARYYGPNQQPRLEIGYRNKVEVDAGGHAQMTELSDYQSTVGARTWEGVIKYAEQLKGRKVKIAFFNATPQGGGVALMRHALIRFFILLDVDVKW